MKTAHGRATRNVTNSQVRGTDVATCSGVASIES
jgi:hypothetical protein